MVSARSWHREFFPPASVLSRPRPRRSQASASPTWTERYRPQDNFYRYSNGGWIRKNPLKPAYSRFGTFDILQDTATSQIRHIVEELIAKPQTKGTNDYRVAVLYKQSLDSAERNRQGYKPLIPDAPSPSGNPNQGRPPQAHRSAGPGLWSGLSLRHGRRS